LCVSFPVRFRVRGPEEALRMTGPAEIEAKTLDVGVGGLAFVTQYCLPFKTGLFIKIKLYKEDGAGQRNFFDPVSLEGEVRSAVTYTPQEYRIGIRFTQIDETEKDLVDRFVVSGLHL